MKKYNKTNFFKHTFCNWELVPFDIIEDKKPNYKSDKGSCYYFEEDGLYRYSNHWGRVANCRWKLSVKEQSIQKVSQEYYVGYAAWTSFLPNNENEAAFVILVDFDQKEISFDHFIQHEDCSLCRRNATETAKRISEIKKILLSDDWIKYLNFDNLELLRKLVVHELVTTNKSLLDIKRSLIKR